MPDVIFTTVIRPPHISTMQLECCEEPCKKATINEEIQVTAIAPYVIGIKKTLPETETRWFCNAVSKVKSEGLISAWANPPFYFPPLTVSEPSVILMMIVGIVYLTGLVRRFKRKRNREM